MANPDRTADRASYLCAAYGCPLLGTRSTSTSGGDFMCHVHAGRDPGELQAVTVEINRLGWLSTAIFDLRTRAHNPGWRETYARIDHDIALAQREDLRFKSGSVNAWMVKLEDELKRLVKVAIEPQQEQRAMEV